MLATDDQRGGVDETGAATSAQLYVQISSGTSTEGINGSQALIAHQRGKLAAQVTLHILRIVRFECSIVRLMEQDDNRHNFARMHLGRSQALVLSRRDQALVPVRGELHPQIVH